MCPPHRPQHISLWSDHSWGRVPWDPGWHQHAWPSPGVWRGQHHLPHPGFQVRTPADWTEILPRAGPFAGPMLPPACWPQYCSSGTRLSPVGGTQEAHRAGVKTRLRGHSERPQCHMECHFRAWKPGPVWLQSPLLISPHGTCSQGKLGVMWSARAAGQSPLRMQTPPPLPLTSPVYTLGKWGAGPAQTLGTTRLAGRQGTSLSASNAPRFSLLPPKSQKGHL